MGCECSDVEVRRVTVERENWSWGPRLFLCASEGGEGVSFANRAWWRYRAAIHSGLVGAPPLQRLWEMRVVSRTVRTTRTVLTSSGESDTPSGVRQCLSQYASSMCGGRGRRRPSAPGVFTTRPVSVFIAHQRVALRSDEPYPCETDQHNASIMGGPVDHRQKVNCFLLLKSHWR